MKSEEQKPMKAGDTVTLIGNRMLIAHVVYPNGHKFVIKKMYKQDAWAELNSVSNCPMCSHIVLEINSQWLEADTGEEMPEP